MKMEKEIIIHIGFAKTATTTIQESMHSSAELLLENNIYYPTMRSNHGRMLISILHDQPESLRFNIQAELTTKQITARNNDYQNIIETKLRDEKIQKVIFSGEELGSLDNKLVAKLQQWLAQFSNKITIICCTRNPIDWYTSLAQQRLKSRRSTISAHGLSSKSLSYMSLKPYIQCFGAENTIVYDFDKHKNRLYQKFLESCRLKPVLISKLTATPLRMRNASFSQEAALIHDALNRLRPVNPAKKVSFKETKYLLKIKGEKFQLKKEQLTEALKKKQEDIQWITETFNEECGYYSDWPTAILKKPVSSHPPFQKETLDSLAIIIDDLATENTILRSGAQLNAKLTLKKIIRRLLRRILPSTNPPRDKH
jgi:hypothetical protein